MTKKELCKIIKKASKDAKIVLEVMDSNGEPYSADVTAIFINEIGDIVITDDCFYKE